jgi:hypothetical protein
MVAGWVAGGVGSPHDYDGSGPGGLFVNTRAYGRPRAGAGDSLLSPHSVLDHASASPSNVMLGARAPPRGSHCFAFIAFRVKPTHSLPTTTQGEGGMQHVYTLLCLIPTAGRTAEPAPRHAVQSKGMHSGYSGSHRLLGVAAPTPVASPTLRPASVQRTLRLCPQAVAVPLSFAAPTWPAVPSAGLQRRRLRWPAPGRCS